MKLKSKSCIPGIIIAASIASIAAIDSCAPKGQKSTSKEFENSANICLDINNFAKAKSQSNTDQAPETIFADKKMSERRILVDLIGGYQGALVKLQAPPVNPSNKPSEKPDPQSIEGGGQPKPSSSTLSSSSSISSSTSSSTSSSSANSSGSTTIPVSTNSDGSGAGCRQYAGVGAYAGIPPHYSQVKDADTAKRIVARYCNQLQALDAPSCKYTPTPSNNPAPTGTKICAELGSEKPNWLDDNCEVISATTLGGLNKFAGEACKIIGKAATQANPAGCAADVLIGVCSAQAKGAGDVINYLNAANPSREQLDQQMIDTITGAFYKTAFFCIRSVGTAALKKAIKDNAGSSAAYWAGKTLGVDYVKKVLTDYKPNIALDAAKEVAFAVCAAAANSLADSIGAVPPSTYQNDCGPRTPEESQARVASCFRTSASSCNAFSGKVDFAKIIGAKSGGLKITADVVSAVAQTGCSVGGEASKLACGAISESTKAIIEAITTGNNSWADCAGTTKLGQCIGSRLGSGGWTNNNGVSEPTGTGENQRRDCCWCQRTWYENDWGSDTPYKSENFVGVIQQGDFQSGNCARPGGVLEGHKFWDSSEKRPSGWDAYYSYSQCKKVTLKGDSCVTGVEYYENGRPSGYVVRKGFWKP